MTDRPIRWRLRPAVLATDMRDGTLMLLDLDSKFYFRLNETAAAVVSRIAGGSGAGVTELAGLLCERYEVTWTESETDVAALLAGLAAEHLIERA